MLQTTSDYYLLEDIMCEPKYENNGYPSDNLHRISRLQALGLVIEKNVVTSEDQTLVFLGAGTIIVNSRRITGLTTAAGLWASACIGLAIGIGFYEGAIVGTVLVFFTEKVLHDFTRNVRKKMNIDDDGVEKKDIKD